MNWRILLLGSAFIIIVFFSFFGFQIINNRKLAAVPQTESTSSIVRYENNIVPEQAQRAVEKEVKNQNQLVRGRVSTYNSNTNTLTVAIEQKQFDSSFAVIGLLEILVDNKLINNFLCWPEFFTTANGSQIDVKQSYFDLQNNSYLFMKGETKKDISQLETYLEGSPYVFALLTQPLTVSGEQEVIKDTSEITRQSVKELAILGCNETN
jgi:hypothetical protein